MTLLGINTNLPSLRAISALGRAQRELHTSFERLSTGKRINRGADDPAGLIASEDFARQQASISKRLEMLERESYHLGAVDGARGVVGDLLIELRGVVQQAAGGSFVTDEERQALQDEASSILQTIDHLSNTTTFNGEQVLSSVNTRTLGLSGIDLSAGDLAEIQARVDEAAQANATGRGAAGARAGQIEHERNALLVELENVADAKSRILDTDFAAEAAKLVRAQLMESAAAFVTQLATRTQAQTVLALLGVKSAI